MKKLKNFKCVILPNRDRESWCNATWVDVNRGNGAEIKQAKVRHVSDNNLLICSFVA